MAPVERSTVRQSRFSTGFQQRHRRERTTAERRSSPESLVRRFPERSTAPARVDRTEHSGRRRTLLVRNSARRRPPARRSRHRNHDAGIGERRRGGQDAVVCQPPIGLARDAPSDSRFDRQSDTADGGRHRGDPPVADAEGNRGNQKGHHRQGGHDASRSGVDQHSWRRYVGQRSHPTHGPTASGGESPGWRTRTRLLRSTTATVTVVPRRTGSMPLRPTIGTDVLVYR